MISFDKQIYCNAAVIQACEDYRQLADIRYFENKTQILCEINNPQADPELITNEFCNYVLNLTVMMGGTTN